MQTFLFHFSPKYSVCPHQISLAALFCVFSLSLIQCIQACSNGPVLTRLTKTQTIMPCQRAHIISSNILSSNTSYKPTHKKQTHTQTRTHISIQLLHCRPHYDRQTKRHQRIFTHHLQPLSSSFPPSIQTGFPVL